jgi:hypothetical protein
MLVGGLLPSAGCSDTDSTRAKEMTTAEEQEFKAQYDASREIEGKQPE